MGSVEEMMCAVCASVTGGQSGDVCDLASTLCKYDLRNGDLFVLSWAMVRRVRRGSISSELLMCGGGVRSILLLPLVDRCLETIDVCSDCVGFCGNVCCVTAVVKDSVFLALECCSMLYVCVRGVMDVVFFVCIVTRGALSARLWEG